MVLIYQSVKSTVGMATESTLLKNVMTGTRLTTKDAWLIVLGLLMVGPVEGARDSDLMPAPLFVGMEKLY